VTETIHDTLAFFTDLALGDILSVMKFIDPVDAVRVARPVTDNHAQAAKHRAQFQQCPCLGCPQSAGCQAECDQCREYVSGDTERVIG